MPDNCVRRFRWKAGHPHQPLVALESLPTLCPPDVDESEEQTVVLSIQVGGLGLGLGLGAPPPSPGFRRGPRRSSRSSSERPPAPQLRAVRRSSTQSHERRRKAELSCAPSRTIVTTIRAADVAHLAPAYSLSTSVMARAFSDQSADGWRVFRRVPPHHPRES